ncbi:sugar phosphate isomerase/epimerase family protein [Achromobacter sp.]|uniref:sugar phosphate isomerase/epimerase family protein n=1 Tax=Achromobacter sp. TaxID=134375 RepID=UPI00289B10A6|nr:sugar phosphate isomerase/epimerase family protein [Achromobacter sp.]
MADLLTSHGIDAIDIAPGKYFPDFAKAADRDIQKVKEWWAARNIEITGMQALLFGTKGLNVFGSSETRVRLLAHLRDVCRIGGRLGAPRVVFGSPKNRDREGLSDAQVWDIAVPFFRDVGDIAHSFGVTVCLEPNPKSYGANFMTTAEETSAVVRAVDHSAIRMQFDTGALTINGEQPDRVLDECAALIGHVHASEPGLVPLGDGGTDHNKMSSALRRYLPAHVVSIEMVATMNEPHVQSIARAITVAMNAYGDGCRESAA